MDSRRVVLAVMCVRYFLVLLDVTIVNVALPSIDAGLGAGVSGLGWAGPAAGMSSHGPGHAAAWNEFWQARASQDRRP